VPGNASTFCHAGSVCKELGSDPDCSASDGLNHKSPNRLSMTAALCKRGWVKECWRGDASKGTVFKDYQIKENT
jgi:hypothetical protein